MNAVLDISAGKKLVMPAAKQIVAAGSAPTVLVEDQFTGVDGTLLDAHTPDIDVVGGGWNRFTITGTGVADIQSNRASFNFFGAYGYKIDTGAADCTITALLELVGGEASGIAYRVTDGSNYFVATALGNNGNAINIYEETSGVLVLRASKTVVLANGDHLATLQLIGDTATFTVNGSSVSFTTSIRNNVTSHGIATLSGTPFMNIDNWKAVS